MSSTRILAIPAFIAAAIFGKAAVVGDPPAPDPGYDPDACYVEDDYRKCCDDVGLANPSCTNCLHREVPNQGQWGTTALIEVFTEEPGATLGDNWVNNPIECIVYETICALVTPSGCLQTNVIISLGECDDWSMELYQFCFTAN